MNGAIAELPPNPNNKLNSISRDIIGINHQSFLCHIKNNSSPNMPNLDMKLMSASYLLTHGIVSLIFLP